MDVERIDYYSFKVILSPKEYGDMIVWVRDRGKSIGDVFASVVKIAFNEFFKDLNS